MDGSKQQLHTVRNPPPSKKAAPSLHDDDGPTNYVTCVVRRESDLAGRQNTYCCILGGNDNIVVWLEFGKEDVEQEVVEWWGKVKITPTSSSFRCLFCDAVFGYHPVSLYIPSD